jgi:hypothetical protein
MFAIYARFYEAANTGGRRKETEDRSKSAQRQIAAVGVMTVCTYLRFASALRCRQGFPIEALTMVAWIDLVGLVFRDYDR